MNINRHIQAFEIARSARDPKGICSAILGACKQVTAEGADPCADSAICLMVCQLAWLTRARYDNGTFLHLYRVVRHKANGGLEL